MKKLLTLLFLFIAFHYCSAQTYDWAFAAGGVGEDRAFGITTDTSGNVYTTGQFRSTATFGSTTVTSVGVEDVFVVKQDASGNVLWVFRGGGGGPDIGYDIVTDAAGNCYVAGEYYDQATFGSVTLNSTGTGDHEIFVLKINASGVLQWAKSAGGADYDVARGIAISGNQLYVSGNFQNTATFGNISVTGVNLYDVFVAKYTLNGVVNWVATGGGSGYDISNAVCADASGNAYLTGYFQSTATFGSNTIVNSSTIYTDMFVAKVNSSGTFLWAQRGGNSGDDDIGRAIDCDTAGNAYVGGEFRGTATFNNITVTNAGIADIFVAKYNTSGVIQYVSTEGGEGGDYCYGLAVSPSKVYITGLFNGTVQFGSTSLTSAGSNDIYLSELDASSGAFVWTERAGGLGDDAGRAVAFNADGFIAYAGDFEHDGSTFGQFTLNSNGGHDIFIAKVEVSSCATATVTINAGGPTSFCEGGAVLLTSTTANAVSFQWKKDGMNIPGATNAIFSANSTGTYTLVVTDNCGSFTTSNAITVSVTKSPHAKVTPSGSINICSGDSLLLTANMPAGVSYQWTRNNVVLPGKTNSTLLVTSAGNYRVIVTKNSTGCSATSKPAKVKVTCRQSDTETEIAIYPNPSATGFILKGLSENVRVEISNLAGQVIEQMELNPGMRFGENLAAGIYFARIYSTAGSQRILKVIKE